MIRRIEIRNFMSHPHTVIEPAEGLTVIVGGNNTGKSALIGALQVLCRNAPGDYMVRHGEKECSIRVVTGEGDEIEWLRKGKVVSYRINGKDIHRLGGGVPDELHELLRLPLVETETDPFDIHFGEQKKPIFLLNETPSRRATFFASSSDTIKLIEIQNRHRRGIQDAKAEENELIRREAGLKGRLDRLAEVDRLGETLDRLEECRAEILAAIAAAEKLGDMIRIREQAESDVEKCSLLSAATRDLAAPPLIEAVDPLRRLIGRIVAGTAEIRKAGDRIAAVRGVTTPPCLSDTRGLKDRIDRIAACEKTAEVNGAILEAAEPLSPIPCLNDTVGLSAIIVRIGRLQRELSVQENRAGALGVLTGPPATESPENLRRLIAAMESVNSDLNTAENRGRFLDNLPPPPETADPSGLKSLIQKLATVVETCAESERIFEKVREETAAKETELKACIAETGVCPTCGQEIDPERFIENIPIAGGGRG